MHGNHLISIHSPKKKSLSVDIERVGYVQGIPHNLINLSPRERKIQSKVYLKSISKLPHKEINNIATQSDSITNLQSEIQSNYLKNHEKTKNSAEKSERFFHLNPNSQFSRHYQNIKCKEIAKLKTQLFPPELNDDVAYVPDYYSSTLRDPIQLNETFHDIRLKKNIKDNSIGNLLQSQLMPKKINLDKISAHKFSTYSTGWKNFYSQRPENLTREKMKVFAKSFLKFD